MIILGISAFYHDSAACVLRDGQIIAAAQEERFTRKKHDAGFPSHAIDYCISQLGVSLDEIDYVSFYDKPFLKFERILETYLAFAPRGIASFSKAAPVWIKEKLFQRSIIKAELKKYCKDYDWEKRVLFSEHHLSHAASAFYPSPFNKAIILTMDGVGEWATTSVSHGDGRQLKIVKEMHFPHSLGLLYSAFTHYTGFKVNSGEYKVMGLAPYGRPIYAQTILENLIDVKGDGSFRLNLDYFDFCTGLRMTNDKFHRLFGDNPRRADSEIRQRDIDLAASIQDVTEEIMIKLTRSLAMESGQENLCMAGGVALNCVANGRILKDGHFKNVWIQPAAGDAGGAIGAAYSAHHLFVGENRSLNGDRDAMSGSFLGPEFSCGDIEQFLQSMGAPYESIEDENLFVDKVSKLLAEGKVIGWFQGRMEFGPRALGARSILADPRKAEMQSQLNLKIKYRESFRPFAPIVLRTDLEDWFELSCDSPYMLLTARVAASKAKPLAANIDNLSIMEKLRINRSAIPAVTHVDQSARVQTVHEDTNPLLYKLLKTFKDITQCPVLINTSFNIRGEPIVCSPQDAYRCFMGTEMDALVIDKLILNKVEQSQTMKKDYRQTVSLD